MGLGNLFKRQDKGVPTGVEKKLRLCMGYAKLWSDYFAYYSDRLEGQVIPPEKEEEFFRIMSALAMRMFEFSTEMGSDFRAEKQLRALLGDTPSLLHLQLMSEAEFSATQVRWHEVFIEMHKTRGRLVLKLPAQSAARAEKGKEAAASEAQ